VLVAACDSEILGKTFKHGELIFEVRESFYKGARMEIKEAIELIRNATNANLVGSNIVNAAIQEGLVHPEAVLVICGIPHAIIVRL
jgi:hypothetical protein